MAMFECNLNSNLVTLLWTNPKIKQSYGATENLLFNAQTITVSKEYKSYIIECDGYTGNMGDDSYRCINNIFVSKDGKYILSGISNNESRNLVGVRQFNKSGLNFIFKNGYAVNNLNEKPAQSDVYAVPLRIYGCDISI